MPRVLRILLVVALVTVVAVVVGVLVISGDDEPDQPTASPPVPTSTPLDEVDTTTVAIERAPFCDAVDPTAVEAALGEEPVEGAAYDNGQRDTIVPGVRDVAHEYSCLWRTGTATARAWVFAPPVTPALARDLIRQARGEPGCREIARAPAYGGPSVGLVCERRPGELASYRGLFGDAWLTCSLSGRLPSPELVERTGRWCVAVAQATTTARAE